MSGLRRGDDAVKAAGSDGHRSAHLLGAAVSPRGKIGQFAPIGEAEGVLILDRVGAAGQTVEAENQ